MKRLIGIYVFILLHISCKTTHKTVNPSFFKEGKIVFETSPSVTDEGKKQLENHFDSLVNILANKAAADSNQMLKRSDIMAFKNMVLSDILDAKKASLTIKVNGDNIWRYRQEEGQTYIKCERIGKNDGFLHYYSYPDTITERNPYFKLFQSKTEYTIQIDKQQRKKILGYDCYKVILIQKEGEQDNDVPISLGDTVFEMFVTDDILIPAHSVYNFGQFFSFFPLEIVTYGSNIKGLKDIYKVKSIDQDK